MTPAGGAGGNSQSNQGLDFGLVGRTVVGIGTDVIEVSRIKQALERPGFMKRVYSESEIAYCLGSNQSVDAVDSDKSDAYNVSELTDLAIQRFAVRFTAKEAVLKAMGVGLGAVKFADISTLSSESGAPELVLTGTAQALAQKQGISGWLVSLSHSDLVAQAFVAATGD